MVPCVFAHNKALRKRSTADAPWIIVPSQAKWLRDLVVAVAVLDAMRSHNAHWDSVLAEKGAAGRAAIANYRRRTMREK